MQAEHFKIKGMEQQFVEFRYMEYNILLTRFEKIRVESSSEEARFLYFIYIFRKENKVVGKNQDKQTFNIICFNRVYHTYNEFMQNIDAILSEYILDEEELWKCLKLAKKLNPDYIRKLMNKE
ncbi:hypothetical protein Q75_02840 [Bacillus coahuilensis p1.1.43]|uniref:IDEAL domain-containing protein n=1 Tax=Bacillus coahuilensis p1.1.43 TaxID=1150625 RepID=A0A147KBD9_9BACI|nr:hypothetical protein [Bacillus coahuilensis]KUP08450.1 hypothetical protein Q75_02840 [Bacillus coahuilensis p1.1.43]